MAKKQGDELATTTEVRSMVPPWIQRMQNLAAKHLNDADVEEIVVNQIKRAKDGDTNAIKFVFGQLMGGQALKGATFIQNNYGSDFSERPGPTPAPAGSDEKIEKMRRRAEQGLSLTDEDDGPDLSLD